MRRSWTEEEIAYLRSAYEECGLVVCAKKLRRQKTAVQAMALRLGLRLQKPWTRKQEDWLKANYHKGTAACAMHLSRSRQAIRAKAEKLGIQGERAGWTAEEDVILREGYPEEGSRSIVDDIGRSRSAVCCRARRLKVKFDREIELAKARVLYYRGWSDACIDREMNKTFNWFHYWRRGPIRKPCRCPECKAKRNGGTVRKLIDEDDET